MFFFVFGPIPVNWISGETLSLRMKPFEVVDIQNEMKYSRPFPFSIMLAPFISPRQGHQ